MKLFVFLSFLFHGADAASFNVAFAAGVAARVETVLDEPWTRALDPLAAAFNSRLSVLLFNFDILQQSTTTIKNIYYSYPYSP